jgi:hypothetical protein
MTLRLKGITDKTVSPFFIVQHIFTLNVLPC